LSFLCPSSYHSSQLSTPLTRIKDTLLPGIVNHMLYLITGEWTENPNESAQETAALWEQITRPSLEAIAKVVDDKKAGGGFVGQGAGAFIAEASSNEELGKTLAGLPFWGCLKWTVIPLESFGSAIQVDSMAFSRTK
jgi:hypothetical protein